MTAAEVTHGILLEIWSERIAQNEKWGEQNHPNVDPVWLDASTLATALEFVAKDVKEEVDRKAEEGRSNYVDILREEVAEAKVEAFRGDDAALRVELVQVAAVAVQWIEAIDRRTAEAGS